MAAGGLFVAGGGAYYMSQIGTVKQLEKEHDVLATKTFVAKGKFKRAESDILESESLIKALQQQTDLDMRAITAISQELEAAKLQVGQEDANLVLAASVTCLGCAFLTWHCVKPTYVVCSSSSSVAACRAHLHCLLFLASICYARIHPTVHSKNTHTSQAFIRMLIYYRPTPNRPV